MLLFIKAFAFVVYTLAVFLFYHYLTVSHSLSSYKDWLLDPLPEDDYDYIVVGAGSAGSIIASGLSEGKTRVLLVEAGSKPAYFFDIPILAPLLQGSPYDWQYKTVPQKDACRGLLNNQSLWPQGKVLGGSSRLNYMAYVPGHPLDYEDWFPEFAEHKLENNDSIINDAEWHTTLSDVIIEAVREISQNTNNDFRRVRLTMSNGERWSTDRLLEGNSPKNLRILTHSSVNKLIFEGNEARGIEFVKWGTKYKTFARRGIIVCAGAIGSPKLLMLSGIGPKKHLEELGINVINDLPVGQNLVDHILTGLDLITISNSSSLSIDEVLNTISALNYAIFRQGPWTTSGIEALGTFHTGSQNVDSEAPALQLMMLPVGISQDSGVVLRKSMGITDEIFHRYFGPLIFKSAITIAPVLLHPKSSGEVKLVSTDPFEDPSIDPRYLSHEDDVSTLISGIQLVKRLLETEAMKKIGASLYDAKFPGCENLIFDTLDYWECYVRHLTLTSYHPAGTCRIGSVVDKHFRVSGMKNLWVVDASVLPELPSGNINAAVMMLAQRALKLLKKNERRKIFIDRRNTCPRFIGHSPYRPSAEYEIFLRRSCHVRV